MNETLGNSQFNNLVILFHVTGPLYLRDDLPYNEEFIEGIKRWLQYLLLRKETDLFN